MFQKYRYWNKFFRCLDKKCSFEAEESETMGKLFGEHKEDTLKTLSWVMQTVMKPANTEELNETTTEELNEEQLRTLRNTREQDVNRIKKEIEEKLTQFKEVINLTSLNFTR